MSLFQNPVHPTTGILAVFVALNYCDVVHIAGFGYPNSKREMQPIHYFGHDIMKSMKVGGVCSLPHACCKTAVLYLLVFSAAEFLPWSQSWNRSLKKAPRLRSHFIPALRFVMACHRDSCALHHTTFLWVKFLHHSKIIICWDGFPIFSLFSSSSLIAVITTFCHLHLGFCRTHQTWIITCCPSLNWKIISNGGFWGQLRRFGVDVRIICLPTQIIIFWWETGNYFRFHGLEILFCIFHEIMCLIYFFCEKTGVTLSLDILFCAKPYK